MVLLLAKNSKVKCLFRPNFLKQVVIEIQKMEHPRQNFSKYPPPRGQIPRVRALEEKATVDSNHGVMENQFSPQHVTSDIF